MFVCDSNAAAINTTTFILINVSTAPLLYRHNRTYAYHQAVQNIADHFLVIGLTSDLDGFTTVLEFLLPQMVQGLHDIYAENCE